MHLACQWLAWARQGDRDGPSPWACWPGSRAQGHARRLGRGPMGTPRHACHDDAGAPRIVALPRIDAKDCQPTQSRDETRWPARWHAGCNRYIATRRYTAMWGIWCVETPDPLPDPTPCSRVGQGLTLASAPGRQYEGKCNQYYHWGAGEPATEAMDPRRSLARGVHRLLRRCDPRTVGEGGQCAYPRPAPATGFEADQEAVAAIPPHPPLMWGMSPDRFLRVRGDAQESIRRKAATCGQILARGLHTSDRGMDAA